ncbi:MAG TPA: CRTAC1 family protein [Terriglobales bacterium]|jgi:hypothetical protein
MTRFFLRQLYLVFLLCFLLQAVRAQETIKEDPAEIRFTDITNSSGIAFEHALSPEKKYLIESMSGGVLLLDYDQDGWLDLYFTNAQSIAMAQQGKKVKSALYRNNHDLTFSDVTDKAGVGFPCSAMGGAVGDYNNDGWADIAITCQDGLVLFKNNGNGTFSNVTKDAKLTDPRWTTGVAFGDYDGDGLVDLMVTRYVEFDLKNLPVFGEGATCHYRGIPVQCGPRGLKGMNDSLYHNNGDGTFTETSKSAGVDDGERYYGLGLTWSDLDDDGRPDLFVADDSTPNYLYRNDGNGRFSNLSFISGTAVTGEGSETAGMGVAVCDYAHTGRLSILVTTFEDQATVLYDNRGSMNFTDVSFASGLATPTVKLLKWGIGCEDFENDGWADVFIVSGHVYPQVDSLAAGAKYREPKIVLRNNRNGTFRDVTSEAGPALTLPEPSRGAAFGDLDNDGKIDVVVENIDGKPMILRNTSTGTNHWIGFRLEGKRSNRLAIGASVKVTAGEMVQRGEIHSGGSYLSQNDLRVHFGLRKATSIDKVEVRWPSGETSRFTNLVADHYYLVKEGENAVRPDR